MSRTARADTVAVVVAATFPLLLTWLYFVVLAGGPQPVQQTVYVVGKLLQFGFPAVWVLLVARRRGRETPPAPVDRPLLSRSASLLLGLAFGLGVMAAMLAVYRHWLKFDPAIAAAAPRVLAKVSDFGVDNVAKYCLLATFYSLPHSLLEEYYWRWFVFGRMQRLMPTWWAIGLSSVAFMGHHVIVLATYFGWASWTTWCFSLAVAGGGAAWAWLYANSRSLAGPWLSHLLVDVAIFVVGYDLVGAALSGN